MSVGYSVKIRTVVSTWLNLVFLLALVAFLGFIEYFQSYQTKVHTASLVEAPLKKDFLSTVSLINFKNRIGQFQLQQVQENWLLQKPRVIPAKSKTVKQILRSLENIKVQTLHELEPINFQSYSLDKPTFEIDLVSKDTTKINIKVGLINPINNTSYITVSGFDRIFQINILENNFEKLQLTDFIDARIFSMRSKHVVEYKLLQGKSKKISNQFVLENGQWKTAKYNHFSQEKFEKKLSKILKTPTYMIIDKQDEQLKTFIANYIDSPLYEIQIKLKDGQTIKYKVSSLIKAIPELKINKRQFFIISASNRPYPYLIHKKYLEKFFIRYNDIKK